MWLRHAVPCASHCVVCSGIKSSRRSVAYAEQIVPFNEHLISSLVRSIRWNELNSFLLIFMSVSLFGSIMTKQQSADTSLKWNNKFNLLMCYSISSDVATHSQKNIVLVCIWPQNEFMFVHEMRRHRMYYIQFHAFSILENALRLLTIPNDVWNSHNR